jgi:hypothetical protein
VPQKYKENPTLGVWVNNQRTCFKSGKSDPERKRMLVEIGFDFNLKSMRNEDIWDFQLQKLHGYYEKHGHCELFSVPYRFTFI